MSSKAQDDELVMNLVELALSRPAEERQAYMRSACGEDTELLTQVCRYVEWEERMNGFLLEPLCPPLENEHPFERGELLADRFRIVREVAQGGMGIVYEAEDEKLGRRVALKCAKIGFRKRLPPEVRHATSISHPNVCKIFEIHTAYTSRGETDFLTMEFLEGETLAERLHRGPVPEEEARSIALQLSAGLAEAHRNHVIHGDLKSSNVILAKGPQGSIRAVITDFGLARQPEPGLRTAQSAERCGTPDYMAPELWKGAGLSPASDIYALGVILCELATGKRPYPAEASWEDRLTAKPAASDPKWGKVLDKCLDPDPLKRFPGAEQIAQALAPGHSRRWFVAAAAAAILAALTAGAITYRSMQPRESVRLAMLPLETDSSTAALGADLFRDASSQLARLKGDKRVKVTVVPRTTVERDRVNTPEKARSLLDVSQVLSASLKRESEELVLHAYLTDVRNRTNVREWTVTYPPQQLRYAPVALAGMVTGTLRLPPLTPGPRVNAAAQQDYSRAMSEVRWNSKADDALASFERAVAADPDSPLTYAGLAEAEWLKYFVTDDATWLERANEAAREAELRNPDLAAVLRIEGILDAAAGRYERAEAEYRRAIELEPRNDDAYRRLGQVLEQNNQIDDALAAYRKALEVDPQYYKNYHALGSFYFDRANYAETIKYLSKTVELAPREPNPHYAFGVTYMNYGRFAEAQKELGIAVSLDGTPMALFMLGQVLMYQRKDQEAIPYLLKALTRAQEPLFWMYLGIAYRRIGLKSQAEDANRRGLALAEKGMTRDPRNGKTRSHLAYLCAQLGDRLRAESEIAQALQLSSNDADTRWMAALTYETLGQRDNALAVLSASPDGVLADISRFPDVADLRTDPRFQQILASHQLK